MQDQRPDKGRQDEAPQRRIEGDTLTTACAPQGKGYARANSQGKEHKGKREEYGEWQGIGDLSPRKCEPALRIGELIYGLLDEDSTRLGNRLVTRVQERSTLIAQHRMPEVTQQIVAVTEVGIACGAFARGLDFLLESGSCLTVAPRCEETIDRDLRLLGSPEVERRDQAK